MRWSRQLIFILCLLVLLIRVQAQYRFDSWTTDNGLPQNSVRAMMQTSDGYIWLTTLDGLVRFDGVRFTVFNKSNSKNLPGNRFINLYAEADDTLWVCTEDQGLVRFQNGEFRTFTTADGLPSNKVFAMDKTPEGDLSIFTGDGAAQFDGVRFTKTLTEPETRGFKRLTAASGTFWEVDADSLIQIKTGKKTVYELPANIKETTAFISNFTLVVSLFEDRNGDLWFSTNDEKSNFSANRLFKFSGGNFQEISANNFPRSLVTNMEQDRHGELWISTEEDGACRLSGDGFTCYTPENGFQSKSSRDIFNDREGTLWITTDDAGIFRLTEQVITPLSTKQGLAEKNVYAIYEDKDGAVWLGSHGGLAQYKDGEFKNYKFDDGLIYVDVQSIFRDRENRLWIGSLDGIEYFENGKFHDFKKNLGITGSETGFYSIHQDKKGILWFASDAGLIKYDGTKAEIFTTKDGLPGNNVKTIIENDDGSLWIGTYGGIAHFKDGKFTAYSEKEGLTGNHVRSIYKDETNALWIGTYDSGLSRFKDGKFTNYTIENGLSSNGVFQILEDNNNNFWMSSNQGIYRVSRRQLEEFAEGERQSVTSTLFGKSDGMLIAEANGGGQNAGMKASDGRLWFSTQDGAAIVNPESVEINPLPPPVVIENVRIDNQEQSAIRNPQSAIELSPGQENLEIDYTGLSFIKPEQVRFRYKLEGLEENWTEAGTRRTAFYPHLAPGEYTFHVIAANSDNVWNEQGARLSIIVKPAFYQTWWFYAVCLTIFAAFVYAIYRRRVSQLERARIVQEEFSQKLINAHETERRRIAAGLHDSLGQQLLVIKNWAALELNVLPPESGSREALDEISATASQAVEEVREIIYDLRPYQLDKIGLANTIRFMIEKIAAASGIEFQTNIGEINDLFTPEAEIALYRVVQECVNNIVKHSGATHATVSIEKRENSVNLTIEDNGRGFVADIAGESVRGFGLEGLAERVRMLSGTLAIKSTPDAGTKIEIEITTGGQTARFIN